MIRFHQFLLSLLLSAFACSQQAAEVPVAQTEQAPACPGGGEITADINGPKLDGNALAKLYRKYTGQRVIVSAAAAKIEYRVVIEASPDQPVSHATVAELIRKAVLIQGFEFKADSTDPNLKILAPSKKAEDMGCNLLMGCNLERGRVFDETTPLPEKDNEVISYVMTLKHITPAAASESITRSLATESTYGSIAIVPGASALVITDETSIIRKMIELKQKIDIP